MTELELMEAAIAQARKSLSEGGIPIGSALAGNRKLLAGGHHKRRPQAAAAVPTNAFTTPILSPMRKSIVCATPAELELFATRSSFPLSCPATYAAALL